MQAVDCFNSYTTEDMGVVLVDLKEDKYTYIDWWVWRPIIRLISDFDIINESRLCRMQYNAHIAISQAEAKQIAVLLEQNILPYLHPHNKILLDKSIIEQGDEPIFYKNPEDMDKNYSISYHWLVNFIDFCKISNGFKIT